MKTRLLIGCAFLATQVAAQEAQILTFVNPSLIRARVAVTDILRPTFAGIGQGDRSRVRVTVSFSELSGARAAVRFDPANSEVYCTGDTEARVPLSYRDSRYEGEMPRGRSFRERLPNYYMVHARIADREYAVARVPVVDPLSIATPRRGALQFIDENVVTTFNSGSFGVLWSNSDPHFQFQHENTAVITETLDDGSFRQIGQLTGGGGHSDSSETLSVPPTAMPPATPGHAGRALVVTRYRSTDQTEGPSDFILDEWISSAGAEGEDFMWISCCGSAGIDHVMIGVPNLDEGMRAFERVTGVAPVRGGRHPSRGTENALVSLGRGTYLEIIAPQPDAQPNEMVTSLRTLKGPALVGWAVHVADSKNAAAALEKAGFKPSEQRPGSRITPQGATLEWTTFDVEKPRGAGAPFFIQWSAKTMHPSITSPHGCSMTSFKVEDPAGDEVSRLVKALGVKADVRKAKRAHMHLDLRCGKRTASFDSP